MLLNKWVLFALGLATAILGYLSTVNWSTMLPTYAGAIVIAIGVLLKVIAAIMPPQSQTTIVSTGGSLITHTCVGLLGVFLLLAAVAGGLSACNLPAIEAAAATDVTKAAANLQRIAGGSLSRACATVGVANGYVQALASVLPVANVASAAVVMGDVNALCASGGSLTAIATALAGDWTQLQALATVPK